MLAPPTSRTGVAKSNVRARLAEKNANQLATVNETGNSNGVTMVNIGHTSTIQVQPKQPGRGNRRTDSDGAPPLHLRMVQDVEFIVYPFSLMFYDNACEIDYLKNAAERVPRHILRVTACLILLFSIALGFEGGEYSKASSAVITNHTTYLTRIILIAISLGLACCFGLTSKMTVPYRPKPQFLMTGLLTICGSLWAIATTFQSDRLLSSGTEVRTTDAASFIVFLFIIHGSGRFLFFHLSVFVSGLSSIVWIVTAIYYASSAEHTLRLTWSVLLVLSSLVLSWYVGYRLEILKRRNHLNELKVELGRREKADLRKEAFDLRDEMYVMTLERYDIADVDKKELEFKSPMEQAMAKLQALANNKSLPKDAFLELQKVIGLLGNSSDVFKVQVADQLADKNIRLDDETTRYLFDLVNNNEQMTTSSADGSYDVEPPLSLKHGLTSTTTDEGSGSGPHSEREDHASSTMLSLERSQTQTRLTINPPIGSVPGGVLAKEEKQINELLKNMDTWNFDVFEVNNLTGKPLFFVGTALFKKYNLINKFHIDRVKLSNFLNVIENGYLKTNPYHNSVHASDVARTVHYFLTTSMRSYTTDLEILALIVASLIHDYDHPGRTNAFHVATKDHKAILYNDRAVLEQHHVSASYFILNKDENNIFAELSPKDYQQVRKMIIELVLATDLGAHFDFLAQFKSSVSSGSLDSSSDKLVGPNAFANRLMIHKMALKCGDLGHSTKTLVLHEKWTHRITEEFYRQGDDERKRNIPISPFMDRQKANLPQSQVGFLDFLVIPMFSAWAKFLDLDDTVCPLMTQLKNNKEHWKSQLEVEKKHDTATHTEDKKESTHGDGSNKVAPAP